MKTPARKEAIALQRVDAVAQGEDFRSFLWESMSQNDRARAIGVAGLTRDRVADPISAFTDDERARIRGALLLHISRMQTIATLMAASNTTAQGYLH